MTPSRLEMALMINASSSATADRECATDDGARIAYTLHRAPRPDCPRVVLIHSLALDRSFWDGVLPYLAADAQVLALDCRGHGRSSTGSQPFTTERFGDDVAAVLDALGWPRAVIAGCSMGGCVAQAFAARHPQRAAALALIDTTAWYGAEAPQQWAERAAAARSKGLASLVAFQATRWVSDAFRVSGAAVVQKAMDVFLANDVEAYAATCHMLGAADLRAALPGLAMPVAVFVGEEDYATPVAMAEAIHQAIPHSTLAVLKGARHLTPLEVPQVIARGLAGLIATSSST
jgi:3-oxoadipate enol-lactonase